MADVRGRLLRTSASPARDLGKQDAEGSRLDPRASEEEEDVPSKQATPERKINKQADSSTALAEGEQEPWGWG